jgi:hypothetical protein
MLKHKLVDFIIQFMEEVDKEISEMKLFVRYPYYSMLPDHDLQIPVERKSQIRCRIFLDSRKTLSLLVCYFVLTHSSSIDLSARCFVLLQSLGIWFWRCIT